MGTDPGRLRGLRPDERGVALALERVTGSTARAHDVDGRQGAVDLVLLHPDGRTAAVEVTSLAADRVRRRGTEAGPGRQRWPDPRRPWWTVEGATSSVAATLDDLPAALTALLEVASVARRADKVAGVRDVDERHLVVELGEGALPRRLYAALCTPGTPVPTADPVVPDGLTHLWLTTGWGGSPLLGWQRGAGWSAYPPYSRT
jgi:hypothetical protein